MAQKSIESLHITGYLFERSQHLDSFDNFSMNFV